MSDVIDNTQDKSRRLKITEIFYSIQGEADSIGWPTVFVRLTGCPLRCGYCDTEYAFYGGEWKSFDEIFAEIKSYSPKYITVTGGEPLAQKPAKSFINALATQGYSVSVETSGAMDISDINDSVSRVVDVKTPASGEQDKNKLDNYSLLQANDQIKFVICSRDDYVWSKEFAAQHALLDKCQVLFSPSANEVNPRELAEWILADRLPVRMQMQLHKILWDDEAGR